MQNPTLCAGMSLLKGFLKPFGGYVGIDLRCCKGCAVPLRPRARPPHGRGREKHPTRRAARCSQPPSCAALAARLRALRAQSSQLRKVEIERMQNPSKKAYYMTFLRNDSASTPHDTFETSDTHRYRARFDKHTLL